MHRFIFLLGTFFAATLALPAAPASAPANGRVVQSFDPDWRFFRVDAAAPEVADAEQPQFDDASWRKLNVPHDWSIEGPFDPQNATGGAGGFLPAGVGWYRKHFALPSEYAGKRVFIEFDGVMANSDVWINGTHLGKRPYGYVSFEYELTDHLKFGNGENVVAVRADNSAEPASRWYAGAGIYRHVRLTVTDPVHIDHWATFISTPHIENSAATVHVQTAIRNQSNRDATVEVTLSLLGSNGQSVSAVRMKPVQIGAGQTRNLQQDVAVRNPILWDLEKPLLYSLSLQLKSSNGRTLDSEITPFGIREFHFDADTGFWLNGKNFKIKGVCLHGDAGGFGTAVPLGAWRRRLELLKQLGVNAVRTAHGPPSPQFLDLCDQMGLLVMDEMFDAWTVAKNKYDYHLYFNEWSRTDTRDTVLRDRNHPSIILYSAGNEIHDTPKQELAKGILRPLVDTFHEFDSTRPVTQALFRPNVSHDYDDGLADMLDVIGQNYRENEIVAAHAAKPTRKIVGTENGHDRRVWLALRDNPPYAGQFIWAGIDYIGESHAWPTIGSSSGLLDRSLAPHPDALERQSWWSTEPVVHIARRVAPAFVTEKDPGYGKPVDRFQTAFPDWSPQNVNPHDENVEVYSNCQQVEIFLNGRSLGSQPLPADASPRRWKVPFEAGTLKAVARKEGQVVASEELETSGHPAKVQLTVDRRSVSPDWDDVAYVTATIVDGKGVPVTRADDLVTFGLTGPGVIAAVDNADNQSHEPFQASQRHAYGGRCIAVVKANAASGVITVTAEAPGLAKSSLTIQTIAANNQPKAP